MRILTLSGSARTSSTNVLFLETIAERFQQHEFRRYGNLHQLPLFHADLQERKSPNIVAEFQAALQWAEGLIISTPEYLHNIPAALKNALEWVTTSGEIKGKNILAITLTPHPPRGEKAMQSLVHSLQALDANIIAQLPLYLNEMSLQQDNLELNPKIIDILNEAIQLLE